MTVSDSLLDLLLERGINLIPSVEDIEVFIEVKTLDHVLNVFDLLGSDTAPALKLATKSSAELVRKHTSASTSRKYVHRN
jgi:hypothetical protein